MADQQVTTKPIDYAALVRKVLGEEANKPEAVYEFSNGREFKSTDKTDHGIYVP
jgi:hypothetical protein